MPIVPCSECEQPMRWRGTGSRWEGDYEFTDYRYECSNACQSSAVVSYRLFIPIDIAQKRGV